MTENDAPLAPAFGADGHPDAVTLAGLAADAFHPSVRPPVDTHVRDCSRCQADLAALAGVATQLSELPPPRMPDHVADRLSAALLAEADAPLAPAYGPDGHPAPAILAGLAVDAFDPSVTASLNTHIRGCARCQADQRVLDDIPTRLSALRAPRMPDAVADRLSAAIRTEAAARTPAAGSAPVIGIDAARERRTRRNRWLGVAAAGAVVLAGAGVALGIGLGGGQSGNGTPDAGSQPEPTITASTDAGKGPGASITTHIYGSPAQLQAALPGLVEAGGVYLPHGSPGTNGRPQFTATSVPSACLTALTPGGPIQVVQRAQYERQDAYILIFRTDVSRQYVAVVVTPQCGIGGPHELYRTTFTR